jgi:predicted nucleic acid-binding protein
MVLVDTSVWSLALRRRLAPASPADTRFVEALTALLEDDLAVLVGPVRQELLSGIRDPSQLERLCARLEAFPDVPLGQADWVEAARAANRCRGAGLAGSSVDFLLCPVALRRDLPLLTADHDFARDATVLGLTLIEPPGA